MGNTLRVQSHLCGGWGGKTAWPQETWAGSAWGRQAEGLLRRWNTGGMSRPVSQILHKGCWGLLARELLMWRASISFLHGPAACGTGWLTDRLTDRRAGGGCPAGKKKMFNKAWAIFYFITYFIPIDSAA